MGSAAVLFNFIGNIINSWVMYQRMLIEVGVTDTPMNQKKFKALTKSQVG